MAVIPLPTKRPLRPAPDDDPEAQARPRILVVDDEEGVREMLLTLLGEEGFEVAAVPDAERAWERLEAERFDLLLADHYLGEGRTGIELADAARQAWPDLPTIIFTAYGSMDVAVAALRAGAYDFITKPFRTELMTNAIQRALRERSLRAQVKRLQASHEEASGFGPLVGVSRPMRELFHQARVAAQSGVPTLILGETGTGKGLLARALHDAGPRAGRPFVAVHCHAVPEPELDELLFARPGGAFVRAAKGTLFLDEIADLPGTVQGRLIRTLEEPAQKAGHAASPHLLVSSNQDLEAALATGRLRRDLYHRCGGQVLRLPPLRERGNDILLLAQRFLESQALATGKEVRGLSTEAAELLVGYAWPGNVRELEFAMERAVRLATFDEIRPDDLTDEIRKGSKPRPQTQPPRASQDPAPQGPLASLEDLEKAQIARVLASVRGNKLQAAQILGIDRSTLYRKLARYGILVRGGGA